MTTPTDDPTASRIGRRQLLQTGGLDRRRSARVARRVRRVGERGRARPGRLRPAGRPPLPTVEHRTTASACARRRRSSTRSSTSTPRSPRAARSTRDAQALARPPRRGPPARPPTRLAELTTAGRRRAVRVRQRVVHRPRRPADLRAHRRRRGRGHPAERRPGARHARRRQRAASRWPAAMYQQHGRAAHRRPSCAPRSMAIGADGRPPRRRGGDPRHRRAGGLRQPGAARRGARCPTRTAWSPLYAIPTAVRLARRRSQLVDRRAAARPAPGSRSPIETPADNSLRLRRAMTCRATA